MKRIIQLLFCVLILTTCKKEATTISAFTCDVNSEKWESTLTKCDLFIEETCQQRYIKIIATTMGGNQFSFTLYNYQDSICDEKISMLDYFINNSKNFYEKVDTSILGREVSADYKTNSGVEYYTENDINDKITITSCDSFAKTISGTFNIHFYDIKTGELKYEVNNGKFEDLSYNVQYYN